MQPERFAQRSRLIRDLNISPQAVRLYMLLDDEAWGNDGIARKQVDLAKDLGIAERQLRTLIGELCAGRYLRKRHVMTGNVYDFHRQKTAGSEATYRQEIAARTGKKLPVDLITQEAQESTALRAKTQKRQTACGVCGDTGWELVERVCRGIGVQGYGLCVCRGGEARRSA